METSILQQIQTIAGKGAPTVVKGNVTSTSPLRIVLADDINIQLSESSLLIPGRLQPLRAGGQYFMLSVNNNKIYYVLDLVG